MVSYAPNTQYLNFQHMYDFIDYRSNLKPQICSTEGSIYHTLSTNPRFSKFVSIIHKVGLEGLYDDMLANMTIFVPDNKYLNHIPDSFFKNLDIGTARKILNASIIPKKLKKDLLTSSPVCYYFTRNPSMRMYMTNINNVTRINNCATVVHFDIEANNGIIHVIDNLITETNDHFMN